MKKMVGDFGNIKKVRAGMTTLEIVLHFIIGIGLILSGTGTIINYINSKKNKKHEINSI